MNSTAKSAAMSAPWRNEPSRRKSGTPHAADHAHSRSPEPAERRPACKSGEKPGLASLMVTWVKPQIAQSNTMKATAGTSRRERTWAMLASPMAPRTRWCAIVVLLLTAAGVTAAHAGDLEGRSGPFSWRITDVRQSTTTIDGVLHARHEFTLVVKNVTTRTLTLRSYSGAMSYAGIP